MKSLEILSQYFSYPFVRYALIVGILVSLCASLLGVTLVLKRFSFIGDGLAHVAFGAMAIATVMKLANAMLLILPVTVAAAVLLLKGSRNARIKGDAAIGLLSVSALSLGYLAMSLFSGSSNVSGDVCSSLFGSASILTLTKTDVWLSLAISLAVLLLYGLFYHKLFAVTFDENFAVASGVKAGEYNLLIAVIVALVIVLAMNLVGSLLVSALIIFPALSAMRLFKSFRAVILFSALIGILGAALGILLSILASTPVGATIVAVDLLAFLLCSLTGFFLQGGRNG